MPSRASQRSVSYILIPVMGCIMKVKAWFHQPLYIDIRNALYNESESVVSSAV